VGRAGDSIASNDASWSSLDSAPSPSVFDQCDLKNPLPLILGGRSGPPVTRMRTRQRKARVRQQTRGAGKHSVPERPSVVLGKADSSRVAFVNPIDCIIPEALTPDSTGRGRRFDSFPLPTSIEQTATTRACCCSRTARPPRVGRLPRCAASRLNLSTRSGNRILIEKGRIPQVHFAPQHVYELREGVYASVRRQGFRDNGLGKLREALAHRVGEVRRPAAGAASGG
jgi:hypothetical protein